MKAEAFTERKITLVLTEKEARWLKEMVQNPMCDPLVEDQVSKGIRREFWEALDDIL